MMKTASRPTASYRRLGRLMTTTALALGTVAASALFVTTAGATTGSQVTVSEETVPNMGKVLVAKGTPVYLLSQNHGGCASACQKIWPPVTLPHNVKSATAGRGVQHSKLGTTSGPHGLRQVTYNGHRLYWYVGDNVRGKVKGNFTDQWGKWTAVVVAKAPSSSGGSSASSTTSTSGSGGSNAGSGGVSF
jgi:predicted lipoprotein with Yx(FWY)xxD motif